MSFLSIVVALHTCYILLSIALSFLFFGSNAFWPRTLTKAGTFLGLLVIIRPIALGSIFLYQQMLHWSRQAILNNLPPFWYVLWLPQRSVCVHYAPQWAWDYSNNRYHLGTRITVRTCSSLGIYHLAALGSWTMSLMAHRCSVTLWLELMENWFHFNCKVCNLVVDVWLNLSLSWSHMYLVVG